MQHTLTDISISKGFDRGHVFVCRCGWHSSDGTWDSGAAQYLEHVLTACASCGGPAPEPEHPAADRKCPACRASEVADVRD